MTTLRNYIGGEWIAPGAHLNVVGSSIPTTREVDTATMADAAVGIALWNHHGGKRQHTTVEMKINYLAPVTGHKIVARSRLVRVGRHLCIGHVDLFDGKRNRVGIAIVTYMLL